MFQALMDRIDEEILRWIFLYQPVPAGAGMGEDEEGGAPVAARRPVGRGGPPVAARAREPEMALAGARSVARNLTFNDPTEAPSAFARAEPKEAHGGGDEVQTIRREGKKVGRNDPCPCGSGRKYKKCHGAA
jgi:preprotein translocase subunit SecA